MLNHTISDFMKKKTFILIILIVIGSLFLVPLIAHSIYLLSNQKIADSTDFIAYAKTEEAPKTTLDALQSLITKLFGKDVNIINKIISCESGWNPQAKNAFSSAKGLMQIIDGTWNAYQCKGDVLDPIDNLNCGKKIYDKEGLNPWSSSAAQCWLN